MQQISKEARDYFLTRHGARKVYIYSRQWSAYWRSNRMGYVDNKDGAGVYTLVEAYEATMHCGEEKKIFYEFIKPESI